MKIEAVRNEMIRNQLAINNHTYLYVIDYIAMKKKSKQKKLSNLNIWLGIVDAFICAELDCKSTRFCVKNVSSLGEN